MKKIPRVSISIPARNEEKYIEKCLQSIVNSEYPKENLQVFVVDGLSNDSTPQIVKNFDEKYNYIHLIENKRQLTPHALNLGLKASDADYKIILGAHAEIAADFISQNIAVYQNLSDEKLACVGGFLENIFEDESSRIIGLAMSSPFGVGNSHFRTGRKSGYVDTVAFGCYRADLFDEIGYFNETLVRNQDDEFNYRILKNGYKIYLSDKIKSKYYVRASYVKLFKQYYQYGYWKVVVNKIHRNITTLRQIIPLLFVLFLIVGTIFSFFSLVLFKLFILGILSYLILASYSALKFKQKIAGTIQIFKTFIILHISYGMGYLSALKDLLILRKFNTNKNTKLTR